MGRMTCFLNENRNYEKVTDTPDTTKFYKALNALSHHSRQALVLYYLEERSVREISHILGVSERAVYGRISRGREKLRKLLENF